MLKIDKTDAYLLILLPIIYKHIPECLVYLYGSRARKDFREGSDVDIAIDAGAAIPTLTMALIRNDIDESNVPVLVDVVDLNAVSDEMKKQIAKDGVICVR